MNNLLDVLHALKPLWVPLLVPSLAGGGGLAMIVWLRFLFAADSGFSW